MNNAASVSQALLGRSFLIALIMGYFECDKRGKGVDGKYKNTHKTNIADLSGGLFGVDLSSGLLGVNLSGGLLSIDWGGGLFSIHLNGGVN